MNDAPQIFLWRFTQVWEMNPYIEIAQDAKFDITIVEMKGSYGSIHNIPEEVMQRMRARWETLPADWLTYLKEAT